MNILLALLISSGVWAQSGTSLGSGAIVPASTDTSKDFENLPPTPKLNDSTIESEEVNPTYNQGAVGGALGGANGNENSSNSGTQGDTGVGTGAINDSAGPQILDPYQPIP